MSDPQQPFGDTEPRPSLAEQIQCVRRELALRSACYPRWSAPGGRMKPKQAEHEIRCMEAVLATLREVEAGEAGEPCDE